jgi:hypothetical protein
MRSSKSRKTMATDKNSGLFMVTTRRHYTDEYHKKWQSKDYDSKWLHWGSDADAIAVGVAEQIKPGKYKSFDAMYRDVLISVERLTDEELQQRRDNARRYARCCDLAVIRNCVCSYSITCPVHGTRCHGTHD